MNWAGEVTPFSNRTTDLFSVELSLQNGVMTRQTVMRAFIAIPCAFLIAAASESTAGASSQEPESRPTHSLDLASVQGDRPLQIDQQQEEKAIKLSAHLVTILATVSDSAGNLVNDLSRDEFEIFEDNVAQQISGLYRQEQIPLRMVFLFDTSTSIRQRFGFEQRAAARFFRYEREKENAQKT